MTADIELLPLPRTLQHADDADLAAHVQDYARANVAHHTAAKDAEIERLAAEVEKWDLAINGKGGWREQRDKAEVRAERLAEALRPFANLDLRPDGFDKRPDDQTIYVRDRTAITVGDVRRARAALRDHDQEGKDG